MDNWMGKPEFESEKPQKALEVPRGQQTKPELGNSQPAQVPSHALSIKYTELEKAIFRADYLVNKSYLTILSKMPCVDQTANVAKIAQQIRLFKVSRIVFDKNENNLQKLTNLYAAAGSLGIHPVMILHGEADSVELYMGVQSAGKDLEGPFNAFSHNFQGNFVGNSLEATSAITDSEVQERVAPWITGEEITAISAVSGIPSIRGNNPDDNKEFVQGLERVIETMRGKRYTMIVLAQYLSPGHLAVIKSEYEQIYSALSPYAKVVYNYNQSHSQSVSDSVSKNFSLTVGTNTSETLSVGSAESLTKSYTSTTGISVGVKDIAYANHSESLGLAKTLTVTEGKAQMTGRNNAEQRGSGTVHGVADTESRGEGIQFEYHQKTAERMLEHIDEQLKRIRESENYGTFGYAAYFLSAQENDTKTAASAYRAMISGKNSFNEACQINTWVKEENRTGDFETIQQTLTEMKHPVFKLPNGDRVTPATIISSAEMAIAMGLPKKSVPGIIVLETASFGRNVHRLQMDEYSGKEKLELGHIFHMWHTENSPVLLDKRSLASHVFITGSTGSGKSTAIYRILREAAREPKTRFMVIEPAKGEYKDVLGVQDDLNVSIYGTNPQKTPLLKINPFSFPKDIHLLEHIDRLVEIFNACWPMYAAMPAILKDAVERCYAIKGWDLELSENPLGEYPTFKELLEILPEVVKESAYSADTQSDYSGALVTRVKSLTNGINGRIFCAMDELSNEQLFEQNVIIDISRVGSTETKSLVMGLMCMKLQEYRMCSAGRNADLRHITVLEEAHNLLRKTSSEQSQETSNLQGKAVEMITNAIAEMRTYGEGFIIADQSPGLLDMAAIRNTNTKIIFRLPDESDRKLVGSAAGLNNEQISELAKLPTFVAAVYQNNWVEPVLCRIPDPDPQDLKKKYSFQGEAKDHTGSSKGREVSEKLIKDLLKMLLKGRQYENFEIDIESIEEGIFDADMPQGRKLSLLKLAHEYKRTGRLKLWGDSYMGELSRLVVELLQVKRSVEISVIESKDEAALNNRLEELIDCQCKGLSKELKMVICQCMLRDYVAEDGERRKVYDLWRRFVSGC